MTRNWYENPAVWFMVMVVAMVTLFVMNPQLVAGPVRWGLQIVLPLGSIAVIGLAVWTFYDRSREWFEE